MSIHKFLIVLLLATVPAAGQDVSFGDPSSVKAQFAELSAEEKAIRCADVNGEVVKLHPKLQPFCFAVNQLLRPTAHLSEVAGLILQNIPADTVTLSLGDASLFGSFLALAAANRIDIHNGAGAGGAGTTSAVARAGIIDVLGAALEAGAITQTASGTSLTLQGNALALTRFAVGQDAFKFCPTEAPCLTSTEKVLNNLSGAASMSLTKKTSETVPGTVTGAAPAPSTPVSATALLQENAARLTGFNVKYQIFNRLSLRSKLYRDAWRNAMTDPVVISAAMKLTDKSSAFAWLSRNPEEVDKWARESADELDKKLRASPNEVNTAYIQSLWQGLITIAKKNNWVDLQALKDFLAARNAFFVVRQAALDKARQETASGLNVAYTYARPDGQPRTSTVRLAYTLRPRTDPGQPGEVKNDGAVTLNLAAEFYNNAPAGTGTVRDLQAGLQLDRHFGSTVATVAGYYQYQNQPAALQIGTGDLAPNTTIVLPGPAATLLAPKGNLVVAQAKVTFSMKNGVKLPVGVTWSNRTELIKAKEVRGHIGFDFDWSSLLAGSKAQQ